MRFPRGAWPGLAAVALAGAACESAPSAEDLTPVQTLEDFTLRQTRGGKLAYLLRAERAVLRENDQKAALTEPRMELFENGKTSVRVRGRTGNADLSTSQVHLASSVVLELLQERSTMKTEELFYDDKRSGFFTEGPVVLERQGAIVRGRGFEADHRGTSARIFNQESVISTDGKR